MNQIIYQNGIILYNIFFILVILCACTQSVFSKH